MTENNVRNKSFVYSIVFHAVFIILFAFINFSVGMEEEEYVTIGFGSGLSMGSAGPVGQDPVTEKNQPQPEKQKPKLDEKKKVELPKSVNTDKENLITETDKKKEKDDISDEKVKPLSQDDSKTKGTEQVGEGEGGFGFEIDFGGKGMRKIYSYNLPEYPEGVSKEIDVRLRFTIMPDGTVGKIFPLIKADARLELAAINSLRQWRFEPLPQNAKKIDQTVIITFPYRLQ